MRSLFRVTSIRSKLLAGYGIVFVLIILTASLSTHYLVRGIIEAGIENELKNSTSTILTMVRASADISIRNYLRAIAWRNKDIAEYFYQQYQAGTLTEEEAKQQARSVLLSQKIGKTGYIYCVDSKGVAVVHKDKGVEGHNFIYRAFVQEQIKRKQGYLTYYWRNPEEPTPRPKALYMTYFEPWDWIISVSSYREEFAGLVNVDDFRESILNLRFGKTGYSFIVDGKANIVIHPSYKGSVYDLEDEALRSAGLKIVKQKNGKIVYDWQNPDEAGSRKKIVILNHIPELDWIVASSGYLDEFYEPLDRIRNTIIMIACVAMAVMLAITLWISSSITNPLQRLMRHFDTGATGDFTVRMEESSRDEIGRLGHYFNTFMRDLQQYSDTLRNEIQGHRKSEEALKQSEERFRSLTENAPDVIASMSPDGYITYVNPAVEAVLGYAREEIIGKEFLYLVRKEDTKDYLRIFKKIREDRESLLDYNGALVHKDGTLRYFIICGTPTIDDLGKVTGIEGILKDITERIELESHIQQIQRIEAVGTLAGGIAHDFNNILTAIRGSLDLCLLTTPETSPMRRSLKLIENAAVRASDLTRQLLLFSRKQPMETVPIDLNASVDNILKIIERLIGEDITTRVTMEPSLWSVMADKGSIEQVIMNLVINARDAMPDGGDILIQTQNVVVDEAYTKIYPFARAGKHVCLTITDTGMGMDSETQKRIFEPFFTTKDAGKGTGLGLAVVYGIVKQHKGWIVAESTPEEGASFKAYFPAVTIKAHSDRHEEVSFESIRGKGEKILIVEDDTGVLEFAATALTSHGYEIYSAGRSEEAHAIFTRHKDHLSLVFSDVVLPDRNGLDLVEELLNEKPAMRVLMTSGYMDEKSQTKMIKVHDYPFLQKPYTMHELLKSVRFVIDTRAESAKD